MNYYINEFYKNKFYCLNPIIPNNTYYWECSATYHYLVSDQDRSENPLHRLDGPAIIFNDGGKRWFYHGKQISCKTNEEFLKIIKMKAFL